jgi:hypothetical protein
LARNLAGNLLYQSGGLTQTPGASSIAAPQEGHCHVHLFSSLLIAETKRQPCPFSRQRMRLVEIMFVYFGRPSRNSKYSCLDAQRIRQSPVWHLKNGPGPVSSGKSASDHDPKSCRIGAS